MKFEATHLRATVAEFEEKVREAKDLGFPRDTFRELRFAYGQRLILAASLDVASEMYGDKKDKPCSTSSTS